MTPNLKPSERIALLTRLAPVSQAAATVVTAWVPVAKLQAFLAILQVGALGTSATVDAKLRQAKDASGTDAKDIAGKAITQLTKAGSDDNKEVKINAFPEDLDLNNGFTHLALSVTVGTAACLISAVILGLDARFSPAADATSVDEVVG